MVKSKENFECYGEEKMLNKEGFERKVGWKKFGYFDLRWRNHFFLFIETYILFNFFCFFSFFLFFFYFKIPKNKFGRSPFDHKIQISTKLKKTQLIKDRSIQLRSHNTTFSQANKNIVDRRCIDPTWITQYSFQPMLDKT